VRAVRGGEILISLEAPVHVRESLFFTSVQANISADFTIFAESEGSREVGTAVVTALAILIAAKPSPSRPFAAAPRTTTD
jgi:hypothetical protein